MIAANTQFSVSINPKEGLPIHPMTTDGRLHRAEIIRRGQVIAVGYGHTPEAAREDARFDLECSRAPIPGTTFQGRREWRTA